MFVPFVYSSQFHITLCQSLLPPVLSQAASTVVWLCIFFYSFFFFFLFYSFGSPYSSLRRWIFFPWAIWRCLVGWQSERGDKGEEHMMWSKLIWDGKVAWKQREATTKFFCSSVFFQLSLFFFFCLPWEQIWCLSDTAVHIPKYSRMQLVLHQHHSCSPSPSWEQCSVAVGTAVKCC